MLDPPAAQHLVVQPLSSLVAMAGHCVVKLWLAEARCDKAKGDV